MASMARRVLGLRGTRAEPALRGVGHAVERLWLPRTLAFAIGGEDVSFDVRRAGLYLARAPEATPGHNLHFEHCVTDLFLDRLPEDAVVYDIGADHGYYALAAMLHGARRVHAFDPHPANVSIIRDNLLQNDAHFGALVSNIAIMDSQSPPFVGLDHGRPVADPAGAPTRTLDSVVAAYEPPDLVKIDVEGSEVRVLRGARETLADHSPELIVEVHETKLPAMGDGVGDLYDLLDGHDYDLTRIQNPWGEPVVESSFSREPAETDRTYYIHAR